MFVIVSFIKHTFVIRKELAINKKEKFIERIPTSVRFSRSERRRIWALTPNLSEYVKKATLRQLSEDEKRLRGKL